MKSTKLNLTMVPLLALFILGGMTLACNNSNKSEKKSTSADSSVGKTEPSVMNADSARGMKRVGRIGVAQVNRPANEKIALDNTGSYNYAEVMAEYPGGQSAIENYIQTNLTYPEEALENNIEGTVNVRFTIDENGNVGNVRTEGNALGYGLEEAAVKAVTQMGKWTPGKVKNANVRSWYTLPITFRLES